MLTSWLQSEPNSVRRLVTCEEVFSHFCLTLCVYITSPEAGRPKGHFDSFGQESDWITGTDLDQTKSVQVWNVEDIHSLVRQDNIRLLETLNGLTNTSH